MFTDIYFTNLIPFSKENRTVFFQKEAVSKVPDSIIFKAIEKCNFGWSQSIRIWWDLSFKLVNSSGNTTYTYPLMTVTSLQRTKFFIWKEGTVSITQSYGNGNQIIDFEQIKGTAFTGVQVYRGKYLIAEQCFSGKQLQFQINTIISISQSYNKNDLQIIETKKNQDVLNLDYVGLKEIHFSLESNKNKNNKLIVRKTKKW